MILLLGGTSESREVAQVLSANGHEVLYTSTTGIITGLPESVTHTVGALDKTSFNALLHRYPVRCIIDATHPFATTISTLAADVANRAGIPCIRFERETGATAMDDSSIDSVNSLSEAIIAVADIPGVIISTLGTRMLPRLCRELGPRCKDIVVRVLPLGASIAVCEHCGIPPSHIIAMQGPFDKAFNLWCISKFHAAVMITKESGDRGGLKDKVDACRESGCTLVVIRRPMPDDGIVCDTAERCLELLSSMGCK